MKRAEYEAQVKRALVMYKKAGIILTEEEKNTIEVADFDKGMVNELG